MMFPTRTLSALLLAATASLAVLPTAAQARNGQNAALIAGALLGLAAGTTLAHGAEDDVPPPPRYVVPRHVEPMEDEDFAPPTFYRAPHEFRHGWRQDARFRDLDEQPYPYRGWQDAYDGY